MSTLKELIAKHNIKLRVVEQINGNPDWGHPNNGFKLKLLVNGKSFTFPFYQGLGITKDPEVAGVMECLLLDASGPEDFEDFCSEFGYDTDGKRPEKIHKACLRIKAKLSNMLGNDLETFLECERD